MVGIANLLAYKIATIKTVISLVALYIITTAMAT